MDRSTLVTLTADIVAAHASMNEMSLEALVEEIDSIYFKLAGLAGAEGVEIVSATEGTLEPISTKPAVPLEAAFGADKVFCMVCGQGMKTLKRHIATSHDMKPGQYRKAFGIPAGTLNLAAGLAKARAARGKKKGKK